MQVNLSNFTVNKIPVAGSINLTPGEMTLLEGENGAGKSSIIQYLNFNQAKFFQGKNVRFIDQLRLSPLNEISYTQVLSQFQNLRTEKLDLFEQINKKIESFKDHPVNHLSGGQNQLVKIAINLYLSGDIFIFDEPLQYLDKENKKFFEYLISELLKQDKSILMVEHSDTALKEMAGEVFQVVKEDFISVRKSHV